MTRRSHFLIFNVVAASTPAALLIEKLVRRFLLPPEMEDLREWLRPQLAPVAWALVVLAVAAVGLAFRLQGRIYSYALATKKAAAAPEARRVEHARLETLLLATSVPQLPALLATIAFTFGADALPCLAAVAVGTLGVVAQWPALQRLGRS